MGWVPQVAKAIAGGATTFAGAFATAITDGTVTTVEWVAVVAATIVAVAAVYQVPNAVPEPEGRHEAP